MAERQQEVEEGLCWLGSSWGSRNNKEVGGWRSRRCYREDLGRAGVAGAGIEGASAGGMLLVKRQQVVEEGLCCLRASGSNNNNKEVGGRRSCAARAIEKISRGQEWLERVPKACQQEECLWRRDSRRLRRASAGSERVGGAGTTRRLVVGGAAGAIERIFGGQECLERVSNLRGVGRGDACSGDTAGG